MIENSENIEVATNNKSFQRQLFLVLAVGILSISLLVSFVAASINSDQTGKMMVKTGLQHAENAARQSRLALLYGSSENAVEAAKSILAFPDIVHITIINPDLTVLYQIGKEVTTHELSKQDILYNTSPKLLNEDKAEWHYLAPVYLHDNQPIATDNIETIQPPKTNKIIGYVYLASDKTALNESTILSIKHSVFVGFIIAIMIILALKSVLDYFFKPLNELTDIMHRSIQGEMLNYSGTKGPKETEQISTAYNKLVNAIIERDEKLKSHNHLLESLVSMRTQELEAARDAAIEADRHKSEFLSNTTHELRTPLQSIIGYAEVAIEMALEEGQDDLITDLESILQSANHLLSLINTILDITKVEAGAMSLAIEYVNVDEIILQSEKTVQPLIAKNGNKLHVNNTCQNKHINIDKGKLLQIILNLLSNAAKFTHKGSIRFDIDCEQDQLTIRVADSGIGIPCNRQEQIFKPFQQADGSITRQYGGTGLGLSVTEQFCRLMGGAIKLDSVEGEGSTFEVTLPLTFVNKC